jgi:chemotaxis protein CheC
VIDLGELHRDALGEIFNIGVGRAAASLSLVVREEVGLSAPSVRLCRPEEAREALLGAEFRQFSAVTQRYSGAFDARAMLVFPETNALEIVRLMVGAANLTIEELSEFEQEAMCEIGNIILNACMSALADMFRIELEGTLPVHRFGDSAAILDTDDLPADAESRVVLLLQVDMFISRRHINGHIVFLLSVTSLSRMLSLLDGYLAEQGLS